MFIIMGEIAIQALILCGIMYVVARHEADYSFDKVFAVAAGIALGTMLLNAMLIGRFGLLGPVFAIIPCFAFMAYMLVKFCWVSVPKSILITIVFIIVQQGMMFVGRLLVKRITAPMEKNNALVDQHMADMEEARKMMMESFEGAYRGPQTAPPAIADEVPIIQEAVAAAQQAALAAQQRAEKMQQQAAAAAAEGRPVEPPAQETPPESTPASEPAPAPVPEPVAAPASEEAPPTPSEDWAGAEKQIAVSGFVNKKDRCLAIVDGNIVEPGQVITARHRGKTFRWTIRSISKDKLDLEPMDVR